MGHEKFPSGSGGKKVIRWKWLEQMQFVRDYISHRTSSGNIGFVPACSENEETGCPEQDEPSEIDCTDDLPLSLFGELVEGASEVAQVPTLNRSCTQKLDLKRVPSNQLQTRTNKSPIKKRKNVDQQVDLAILKMLKEEKENKVPCGTPSEPDAEASFGKSIAQTMRGFNKYQKVWQR